MACSGPRGTQPFTLTMSNAAWNSTQLPWKQIRREGLRCRREKFWLRVPILQQACEKQCQDRANQLFWVKDGAVSKQTWCHAHKCPVCSTVVWSSRSCSGKHEMLLEKDVATHVGTFPTKTQGKKKKRTSGAPGCLGSCRQGCAKAWQTARCGVVGL